MRLSSDFYSIDFLDAKVCLIVLVWFKEVILSSPMIDKESVPFLLPWIEEVSCESNFKDYNLIEWFLLPN